MCFLCVIQTKEETLTRHTIEQRDSLYWASVCVSVRKEGAKGCGCTDYPNQQAWKEQVYDGYFCPYLVYCWLRMQLPWQQVTVWGRERRTKKTYSFCLWLEADDKMKAIPETAKEKCTIRTLSLSLSLSLCLSLFLSFSLSLSLSSAYSTSWPQAKFFSMKNCSPQLNKQMIQ